MLNSLEMILWIPMFVILLMVIYQTVKSAFHYDGTQSFVISLCVTLLSVMGMQQSMNGSVKVILVPYAVMGISILFVLLIMFIGKHFNKEKQCEDTDDKRSPEVNDRMRR